MSTDGSWKAKNQKTIRIVIIISGKIRKTAKSLITGEHASEVLSGSLTKKQECIICIASQKNREYIGKVFNVIVDGFDDESCLYYGRSYMDAPEIDTGIYFGSLSEHTPGEFVNVIIKDVYEYDLIGEEV